MKLTLLDADSSTEAVIVAAYIIGFIIAMMIIYYFFRWLFAVDKRVKQNSDIIDLLKLIAKTNGAPEDEIKNATNPYLKKNLK
jgi:hypothetical protein